MSLKRIYLLLLLLPFYAIAQQGNLRVQVIQQENKQPILGASVTIVTSTSKAPIKGRQTDSKGVALIESVPSGTYSLQITYVGMQNHDRDNILITADKTLELGIVELVEAGKQLEEVVVQGRVADLQLGIDKKVFDVSQSLVSVGGTAQDLLGNVPTLQVDADGSVSLRGSSSVKILIDGKESAMAGSDVNKLLQSLPADAVSKVEIITNPSAKYDAEGQSGIINIVLKKNIRTGLNGNVNASVGNYDNYNAGITLNYRDNKFNYFGSYNFRHGRNLGEGNTKTIGLTNGIQDLNSLITETFNESFRKGINNSLRLGMDYYANDKTTLSLGGNLSLRDNNRGEDLTYKSYRGQQPAIETPRTSRQFEEDFGYDLTFDFKRELKREGEELTANVTYGNDKEDGTNDYEQRNPTFVSKRFNETGEKGKNWNFQLDYLLPLGENHKFEAGYRTTLRNSNDFQYSDTLANDLWIPDYTVSNEFEMKSGVHALYANYQRMLSEKIGLQVGLRAEDAYLNTENKSVDPDRISTGNYSDKGNLDYFRVYPSAFLTYEVNEEGDKVQLSYSRRVQRPRGWQVNPFVSLSDPLNIRQGNPNLMPEDIHSMELSFAKFYEKWNFITTAYYRRVNDMTQPLQYDTNDPVAAIYLEGKENATFMRWENVGSRNNAGLELISKVNIFKWWDATANANLYYQRVNPVEQYNINKVENVAWDANLTTNVKFTSTTSLQVKGDYRAPMKTLQGNMKSMHGVDLALRQEILKGKGSLMFNVRDVFDNRRFGGETFLPSRYSDFYHRWSRRTFNLTFSYRFGLQDLTKSKRNEERSMDDGDMGNY
ncbi:TonB-dependent receptor domain-containing protein [Sphingobacterium composti Ten et al. 2007 non Yoo et al. 2007]|uniref:TonB-dependent receptor domain-containing protein n=1 Tax=Sphingobacterium composti TaxID=363260 RepID=UPI00135B1833|nr:TonB-dependent receptor [Sphingobacterium composti Ten et al. 2007 non Yoo et al. 2007]